MMNRSKLSNTFLRFDIVLFACSTEQLFAQTTERDAEVEKVEWIDPSNKQKQSMTVERHSETKSGSENNDNSNDLDVPDLPSVVPPPLFVPPSSTASFVPPIPLALQLARAWPLNAAAAAA
jgi:hypothetical protein